MQVIIKHQMKAYNYVMQEFCSQFYPLQVMEDFQIIQHQRKTQELVSLKVFHLELQLILIQELEYLSHKSSIDFYCSFQKIFCQTSLENLAPQYIYQSPLFQDYEAFSLTQSFNPYLLRIFQTQLHIIFFQDCHT